MTFGYPVGQADIQSDILNLFVSGICCSKFGMLFHCVMSSNCCHLLFNKITQVKTYTAMQENEYNPFSTC